MWKKYALHIQQHNLWMLCFCGLFLFFFLLKSWLLGLFCSRYYFQFSFSLLNYNCPQCNRIVLQWKVNIDSPWNKISTHTFKAPIKNLIRNQIVLKAIFFYHRLSWSTEESARRLTFKKKVQIKCSHTQYTQLSFFFVIFVCAFIIIIASFCSVSVFPSVLMVSTYGNNVLISFIGCTIDFSSSFYSEK